MKVTSEWKRKEEKNDGWCKNFSASEKLRNHVEGEDNSVVKIKKKIKQKTKRALGKLQ